MVFNEIPILEHLSSHLLYEQFFELLYIILNGFDYTLSFLIYRNFHFILVYLIAYYFLKKIIPDRTLVFVLILFFPFINILFLKQLYLVFISIFLLVSLYSSYSFKKLLFIFYWTFFIIIWNLSLGVPNSLSTAIFLLFYLITRYTKLLLFQYVKAFIYSAGPIVLIVMVVSQLNNIPLSDNIKQAIDYFGASQFHGYADVAYNKNRFFFVHYFVFPIIILGISVYFMNLKKIKNLNSFAFTSMIFLIIFYFLNIQRGLVRHSLMEGTVSFQSSYIYLVFLLFFITIFTKKNSRFIISIALTTVLIFFSFYPDTGQSSGLFDRLLIKMKKHTQLETKNEKINRLIEDKKFNAKTFNDLKSFLDTTIVKKATFIDFSNTPMLFFYTKRYPSSYFNQTLLSITTEKLQDFAIQKFSELDCPVVIYSNHPRIFWDNVDGVPNTLRHFKIADYIHRNYVPYKIINNSFVLLKKESAKYINQNMVHCIIDTLIPDSAFFEPRITDLGKLAFLWSDNFVSKNNYTDDSIFIPDAGTDKRKHSFRINNDTKKHSFLEIAFNDKINDETTIKIDYGNNEKVNGTFTLIRKPGDEGNKYIIPLSTHYNWIIKNNNFISVENKSSKNIVKLQLFRFF